MVYDITATIVAYKTKISDLEKVVKSFFDTELNIKLYISDNSPTDELKEYFEKLKNDKIEYKFNNFNGGYGWGHNRVIKNILGKSKYHLILNPDIYFKKNVLEELFEYMEKNNDVGNIMPMVKYPNGKIQYLCKRNPSPLDILLRTFCPIKSIVDKRNYKYEMRDIGYEKIMNVDILSGCFMFIRNEVFQKIGMFDEKIFMNFEDADLSRRIHREYKTIFYPNVEIVHEHAREAHKNKKMLWMALKSAIYYFNKYGWFFDSERRESNKKVGKNG
ncbi:MAG: glycosyltransferase family 2 protein [Cetobacterium sp.]